MLIKKLVTILSTVFGVTAVFPVQAQWPDKPITLIAPYTPGGNADILARLIAKPLSERLGQPVIVENRPGAGGMIGSQYVARAKPDGYTFLLGSIANVLYKHFYKDVPADLEAALQPVSQLVNFPNFIVVPPTSTLNSVEDIVDAVKSQPGGVSCGNPGIGTTPYLTCEMLKTRLGVEVTNVPYKGSSPALVDLLGGQITLVVASESLPYIKDGRLKAIAVSSLLPTPLAPDVPPLSRSIDGLDIVSWFGIFAPKGTKQEIVDRLNDEILVVLRSAETRANLTSLGATPVGSTAAEFDKYYQSEIERWQREIAAINIKPN